MRRVQALELEDRTWMPSVLRETGMACLRFAADRANAHGSCHDSADTSAKADPEGLFDWNVQTIPLGPAPVPGIALLDLHPRNVRAHGHVQSAKRAEAEAANLTTSASGIAPILCRKARVHTGPSCDGHHVQPSSGPPTGSECGSPRVCRCAPAGL